MEIDFKKDEHPREGVSLTLLSKLKTVFQKDGTVTAGNPYIIVRLKAVVSYINEDPSLMLFCFSSIRTESSISASNSNIAEMSGASGWLLGMIILPTGIVKDSFTSPFCNTEYTNYKASKALKIALIISSLICILVTLISIDILIRLGNKLKIFDFKIWTVSWKPL